MNILVNTKDLSREEWLQYRRKGIGGSDAAAVAGLNPNSSPTAVYYDKTGDIEPAELYEVNKHGGFKDGKEAVYWGNIHEDTVAREFMQRTGKRVQRRNAMLYHPDHPFMLADLDRVVIGENAGLECKTAGEFLKDDWIDGEEVPEQYFMQCQHYMAVTGADKWYIAVLIGGNKFHWDVIERDEEIISHLIKIEAEFWQGVLNQQPPELDGLDVTKDVLDEMYPAESVEDEAVDLPSDVEKLIAELDSVKENEKAIKERKKEIENNIKAELGSNKKGFVADYQVSWSAVNGTKFDKKSLQVEHPEIYKQYVVSNPYRRFSIKKSKKQTKAVS